MNFFILYSEPRKPSKRYDLDIKNIENNLELLYERFKKEKYLAIFDFMVEKYDPFQKHDRNDRQQDSSCNYKWRKVAV